MCEAANSAGVCISLTVGAQAAALGTFLERRQGRGTAQNALSRLPWPMAPNNTRHTRDDALAAEAELGEHLRSLG